MIHEIRSEDVVAVEQYRSQNVSSSSRADDDSLEAQALDPELLALDKKIAARQQALTTIQAINPQSPRIAQLRADIAELEAKRSQWTRQ
jgi:hypothetical protein